MRFVVTAMSSFLTPAVIAHVSNHPRVKFTVQGEVQGLDIENTQYLSRLTDLQLMDHNPSPDLESIFIGSNDAPIYDIPISAINRPIPSVLDKSKVEDFICKLQAGTATPVPAWQDWQGLAACGSRGIIMAC